MNVKLSKELVGKAILGTGKVIICGLSCMALIAPHVESSIRAVKGLVAKADYSGTIDVILSSDMLGSYKKEAIAVVQKDRDADYYKAIIEVVNSNLLGSYKLETIKKLSD